MAPRDDISEFDIYVTRRLLTAGLVLQDTLAIAADPLVRRRIENVLDELEQVIRAVRDHFFGMDPAPLGDSPDGHLGHWLTRGELALDLAATALSRAGEIDGDWGEDATTVLRSKLDMLRESVGRH